MTKSIDIFCGKCWEPFGPNTTDIGGSEKAVIAMARELSKAGATVRVYGEPPVEGKDVHGTEWLHYNRWTLDTKGDVLVAWRTVTSMAYMAQAGLRNYDSTALWLHDLGTPAMPAPLAAAVDKVMILSDFHAKSFLSTNPTLKDKLYKTANGVELQLYPDDMSTKYANHFFYSSSPRRGLGKLLREWPEVRKKYPNAILHVAYGFELSIKMCESQGDQFTANVFRRLQRQAATTEGVIDYGRVDGATLAAIQRKSEAWLYPPSDFEETFCITALEAQAAYAWPITRQNGALPETVNNKLVWTVDMTTLDVIEKYNSIEEGLIDVLCENREFAEKYTWANVAQAWLKDL